MVSRFFASCRHVMNVLAVAPLRTQQLQVRFIQRKPYRSANKARQVGRMLLNEDAIIRKTAQVLPHADVQGVRMEHMSQREQIALMHRTDVVIGMHGAGMVNIGFMQAGARVIEIFPRAKRRWGYRNLCQYIGLRYVDYRAGTDRGDHKHIDPEEWAAFLARWGVL